MDAGNNNFRIRRRIFGRSDDIVGGLSAWVRRQSITR